MRKMYFLLFVAMLLLFTPGTRAFAEESIDCAAMDETGYTREYVMSKAIEAFPEYSAKICGEQEIVLNTNMSRSVADDQVTFSETRWLSEDEVVTYTEYASGLSTYAYGVVAGKNQTYEYDMGAGVVIYTINMWLQCPSSEDVFIVNDVSFIVRDYATGTITNLGTVYNPGLTVPVATWSYLGGSVQGTDTEPAYIEYSATFEVEFYVAETYVPIYFTGILRLEVGQGYYSVTAN